MLEGLGKHKHLALLVVLLVTLVTQPLVAREGLAVRVSHDLLAILLILVVLSVVFRFRWERQVALLLAVPALALTVARYALPDHRVGPASLAYSISFALFLGFAVAAIVRDIFKGRSVGPDDVIGAFSGYLMLGIVWGSLYSGLEVVAPGSFSVDPEIRWQLEDWHLRRALFLYVSYAVMAGLGYGDVTSTAPLSNILTWIEVMLAQFYLAVVIAQIIGLKLAQAASGRGPDGGR